MYDEAREVENEAEGKTGIHPADINLGRLGHIAGMASVWSSGEAASGGSLV